MMRLDRWHFDSPDGPIEVGAQGRYQANNSEAVRGAVLAGVGIGVLPSFALAREIQNGDVKVLLKRFEPRPLPMHAVYPSRRFVPLKVRAMIDYLAQELEIDPALSGYGMS